MKDKIFEHLPVMYDPKSKTSVVGFEMNEAEKCGAVKFDVLGVSALDKINFAQRLVNDRRREKTTA